MKVRSRTLKRLLCGAVSLATALAMTVTVMAEPAEESDIIEGGAVLYEDYGESEVLSEPAAAATGQVIVSGTYRQDLARQMADKINEFRLSDPWYYNSSNTKVYATGLKKLTYDYSLEKMAMQRAAETAIYFSHSRPKGGLCFTLDNEMGLTSYWYFAENIALGTSSVQSVFNQFAEENENYSGQGHRRNMLTTQGTCVGIGCFQYGNMYFWVEEFRSPNANTKATTADTSRKDVKVDVSSSVVSSVTMPPSVGLTLNVGGTAALPAFDMKAVVKSSYFTRTLSAVTNVSYKSENTSVAAVSGTNVTGKSAGSTNIVATTTYLGQTYTVTYPVTVKTAAQDLANADVTLSPSAYVYDGTAKQPAVTVKMGNTVLKAGTDYKAEYSSNIKAGTGIVNITAVGSSYTGFKSKGFTINKLDIAKTQITAGSFYSNGRARTLIVKYNGQTLKQGTDYSFTSGTDGIGKCYVDVKGVGSVTGSQRVYLGDGTVSNDLTINIVDAGKGTALTSAKIVVKDQSGGTSQVSGYRGKFTPKLDYGIYTLSLTCSGRVTRTFKVSGYSGVFTSDIPLAMPGDIDLNGQRDYLDVSLMISFVNKEESFTDYQFSVADLDGNGQIDYLDLSTLISLI